MFRNREEAALRLARELKGRALHDPIVLGIPRGGVVLAAVLAREWKADLDVVLARKLRHPWQPEAAIGAVAEDGTVYLDERLANRSEEVDNYLKEEIRLQQQEIARRKQLLRGGRPAANVSGRSVLVTDDGIATGATMIAALEALAGQQPREVIVAVPVAEPERLEEVKRLCDEVVCLLSPPDFYAVGQFYQDFRQVEDEEVVGLLQAFARRRQPQAVP